MNTEDIKNLYRHDLGSFLQFAFRELHPHVPYQHNWHIDLIAHYLSLVEQGIIRRLIINLPPRTLKSYCVSVAWAAWLLGREPRKKLLYLHASKSLGQSLETACHTLMSSRRYRALFPTTVIKQQKQKLLTSFGGYRQFMPVMGRLTGLGADNLIIDDPISTLDVRDENERTRLNVQFDENVLQRLHEDDLTSHVLKKEEGWVHLNIPAIALADETWNLPYGNTYVRRKGQLLQPDREGYEQLIDTLHAIGGYAFSYQYLQGLYRPRFGMEGEGCLWLNPMREGVFYDSRKESGPHGFFRFKEIELILPKVFSIGEDPYPDNMRHVMTREEFEISCEVMQEILKKREIERKSS